MDTLQQGMQSCRAVFLTYRSQDATESASYGVYPYKFGWHRGSLYLFGYKPDDAADRTWRVDRIESADLEKLPFQPPRDSDLEERLASAFGIYDGNDPVHIRVRFTGRTARFVSEKRWHRSQQLTPQPDGSLVAEFDLSGTPEIKSWILGFGPAAEVLEPETLRAEIQEELHQMLSNYEQANGPSSPVAGAGQNKSSAVTSFNPQPAGEGVTRQPP